MNYGAGGFRVSPVCLLRDLVTCLPTFTLCSSVLEHGESKRNKGGK